MDPYKVLGVSPNASDDEVKKRRIASWQGSTTLTTMSTIRSPIWRRKR